MAINNARFSSLGNELACRTIINRKACKAEEGKMISPKTLLAIVLLALTSVFGCQMVQSSATVDVPTAETPEDEALSKSVLDRLLMDKKADLTGIRVTSNDGKVYLSGTVKSLDAREQAMKIAWTSPGVRSVVNGLEVQK
jgi:osmotically-inducible protein OsmY